MGTNGPGVVSSGDDGIHIFVIFFKKNPPPLKAEKYN